MQSSPAATEGQAACGLDSLLSFISAAAEANIVSGVQVNLLNDLAGQWCSRKGCNERLSEAAPVEQQQPAGTDHAALSGSTLQHLPSAEVALSHSELVPTSLPEAPQLHIQPLNLSAGLHVHSTTSTQAQQDAAGLRAALATSAAGLPGSDPAAEGLTSHAAALMALTGSMAGVAFDPAAAAAALLQSQAFSHGAAVTTSGQGLGESCSAGTGLLGPSHGLLQALGYTSDPAAAGPAVGTAAAAEATNSKAPAYRKQRFTREQHAAILESVERNFAQYPSRYTELVIKEMQARFPGIELNNACVRKIKFRANEANRLQHTQQPQQDIAGALEHQAAADAAHGLVGLASAAAAAAVAAAAAAADTACTLQPIVATEPTGRSSSVGIEPEEADTGIQQTAATTSPAGAATAGDPVLKLQSEHSDSPETETVSLGTEPSCAALLGPGPTPQQQQQQGTQVQEQRSSGDAAAGSLSNSPALVLKLPQLADGAVGSSPAAGVEDVVDSATAAAAEAMHLLASISSSAKQQPAAPTHHDMPAAAAADRASGAPVSAAGGVAAAAAPLGPFVGGSSKRKREAASGAVDCEVSTSGTATSSPLSGQVAEALSAAADLAGSAAATQHQLGLQQGADAAPGPMSASLDQQQLMQRLLQQQQLQSPWDMAAYNSQLTPLDLQLQQRQQALQFQLGSGLAGSCGMLQGLSAAAAAAAGGQQPAAKRQRLSGAQMAELIASVKHHVQANPERYTHCVIKDMKDKYPDLELNMGQIRKIKFRTLGNANTSKQAGKSASEPSSAAAGGAGAPSELDAAGGLSGAAAAAATAAGMRQ